MSTNLDGPFSCRVKYVRERRQKLEKLGYKMRGVEGGGGGYWQALMRGGGQYLGKVS